MFKIPANYHVTRSTPFFNRQNVPAALLSHHNTKAGVYGRLSVMQGAVKYYGFANEQAQTPEIEVTINAGQFGVSPPQYWHKVELLTEDTYFNLDFFAQDSADAEKSDLTKVVDC
ncbi:DUF1971 domain-containing protein [Obesumbacterium proteus]|uniref:DUF1971 domain-containing protein n=1 Tax=Obesumbacterium proteus TaxID=82983 RepID=UPI001F3523FE|nr:DUF1971 domain-containing protein [Obesumbacterium proteus]MCE9883271.1 DUF1971 domain-containing protein [Obesumbacterium proteus]MCE9917031.1 DUF1971 domain-containing protein [Obesumbacterium proteus]MCE9930932.1 DUF1971 domain-containing protein [Obesumbacterium proteus]MCG2875931.1 DUF1971 domain-containing protein [Obesumbacterium proteus]